MKNISAELAQVNVGLKCNLLANLETKTEDQCLCDEFRAKQEFQEEPARYRLSLKPEDYFKALSTVAFKQVIM